MSHLLFTKDGRPVYTAGGSNSYTLKEKPAFKVLPQIRTLLPPNHSLNRQRLVKAKERLHTDCEWRAA